MSGNEMDLSSLSNCELDEALQQVIESPNDTNSAGIKEIVDERERRIRSESKKEIIFLGGVVEAFKEKIHSDIQLRPGKDDGPCIPAHGVILASRSKIFKIMLQCDATPDHTITIPEMNNEELESFLEFLYSGALARDKMEKHLRLLFHAAHKYEIPYLQECCERYILASLNASNVLGFIEILDAFSSQTIKDTAMNFILENMDDITLSAGYEVFAAKNPHLAVQITRAFVHHAKKEVECMQKEIDLHKPYKAHRFRIHKRTPC